MNDFKVERFRSTGKGGQNVNKVETAVRITHLPTGLVAACQDQRSQTQNYKSAMATLQQRIKEHTEFEKHMRKNKFRVEQMNKGRVRTYNLITNTVTDHVRNVKIQGADKVLEGHLELLGL